MRGVLALCGALLPAVGAGASDFTAQVTLQDALKLYFPQLARSCDFDASGSQADASLVDICLEDVLSLLGLAAGATEGAGQDTITDLCMGRMPGLGSQVAYVNSTRFVCWATPGINLTGFGCELLSQASWKVLTMLMRYLVVCDVDDAVLDVDAKGELGEELFAAVSKLLLREVEQHAATPLGSLFGSRLQLFVEEYTSTFSPSWRLRQIILRTFALVRKISQYVNFVIWRDTHFLWLMESLQQGRVVHTAWGPIERWDELGANDARSQHMLEGSPTQAPRFVFSEEPGQRNNILVNLLTQFHKSLGGSREVTVVEVGVFRAGLSKHILEKLPFVRLVGVDPYIGTDGTFPGDFSVTLRPADAYSAASAVFEQFPERATLLPQTSEAAAASVPDASIDVVFIDGCHLYECVAADLAAWMPKLRGPGSLVVGHDFSPQWPGVVRAVYEHRRGGRQVTLGQDWTFWWQLE